MERKEKTTTNLPYYGDEIDIKEIFGVLWSSKFIISSITLFFAICSIVYALSLPNIYKSESILSVPEGSSDLNSLSGYSGLASLAGINLPTSSGTDKGMLAIQTITSRHFFKHLLTFDNVLVSIMAPLNYDTETKELVFDPELYDVKQGKWIREPSKGSQSVPSYLESYKTYLTLLNISKDSETGFISISVEHISPVFAKNFLDIIIIEINKLMRQEDLRDAEKALEYLTSEVSKTSLVEIRESIYQLIQVQLETQMMAKISNDYVLKIIDPPFFPEDKSKPTRSIICVLGTIMGFLLACLLVLFRYYALGREAR